MSRYPAKLVLFLVLAAGLAHGAASCTAGQSVVGVSTSSTFNTTGASLLVAGTVGYINQNVISDAAANYWNFLSTYGGVTVGPHTTLGWVNSSLNTSASETITNLPLTYISPNAPAAAAVFCTGMNPYPPVAQNGLVNAGASTFTPGAVTALAGQVIVIACGTNGTTVGVTSIANSFITDFTINGSGSNEGLVLFHLVAPSTGSYNPSITMTANTDWACNVGVFSAVGDGALPPTTYGPTVTLQAGVQVGAYGGYGESCNPAALTTGSVLSWPMEIRFMPAVNGVSDVVWNDYFGNAIRYYNRHTTTMTAYGKTIGAGCTALIGGQASNTSGFNYSPTPMPGTSAQLARPAQISLDSANNIYGADQQNHRIFELRYSDGMLFTVAGSGVSTNGNCTNGAFSGDGGPPTSATLSCPQGVWWGSNNGNPYLLISDTFDHRIRAINLAATAQTIFNVSIPPNTIQTIVGNGTAGCSTSGAALSANMQDPVALVVDNGNLYWADDVGTSCFYFFKLTPSGTLSVFAGNGSQGYLAAGVTSASCTSFPFYQPQDINFDSNHVAYLTDQQGGTVSMAKNGVCSNLAGNYALTGNRGGMGPIGPARTFSMEGYLNQSVAGPLAADPDNQGNLWISDSGSNRIVSINLPCYASCMQ